MNCPFGILKRGSYGQYVTYLQYALHILCFRVNGFDGIFGDGTYYAVMNYQNSRQLYADGVVGQATWNQLTSEIYNIQSKLKNNGFYPGKIDGIAGINTYNAIINFQRANNLTPDGMVGNSTFNRLNNPNNYNYSNNQNYQNDDDDDESDDNNYEGNSNDDELPIQPSENLIYFIKMKEGFAPRKYKDIVNKTTMGYGLTGDYIKKIGTEISEEDATIYLTEAVESFFNNVVNILKSNKVKKFRQREVDAFTSFSYNLGISKFRNSTLLQKYIKGERGASIKEEFLKWVHAGGVREEGLVKRREEEWKIFSGSKDPIPGYNTKPNILIFNEYRKIIGTVKENKGYGAAPYE